MICLLAEIAGEDSKETILPLPAVIDLCSLSDDLDDSPEPLLLTAGPLTQQTLQSRGVKPGTVAKDQQQKKVGQPPSAGRTPVVKKRHRKSRDCGEDQHESQRRRSTKSLTPAKAHRRSSKQDAAQAVISKVLLVHSAMSNEHCVLLEFALISGTHAS
jgi:hypothetical protein